jgi:peptide/nickel transport system ATP-binding protein
MTAAANQNHSISAPLLQLQEVSLRYGDKSKKHFKSIGYDKYSGPAVDQVSLQLAAGETLGLVGESGCGKSTLGRIAAGLLLPDSGQRLWRGEDVRQLDAAAQRRARLDVQLIFQNSHAALNPRLRSERLIGEAPVVHGLIRTSERRDWVIQLLQRVGLDASHIDRYPHQFSGGQRARLGIARALAVQPRLLICDEAVAALDVSVQAQVINLLLSLRAEFGLSMLFISHDLDVVRHLSDRVLVMHAGQIVESGATESVYHQPQHAYTRSLLESIPRLARI